MASASGCRPPRNDPEYKTEWPHQSPAGPQSKPRLPSAKRHPISLAKPSPHPPRRSGESRNPENARHRKRDRWQAPLDSVLPRNDPEYKTDTAAPFTRRATKQAPASIPKPSPHPPRRSGESRNPENARRRKRNRWQASSGFRPPPERPGIQDGMTASATRRATKQAPASLGKTASHIPC